MFNQFQSGVFPLNPLLPRIMMLLYSCYGFSSTVCAGTSYDYVREFRRSTGTWHPTRPLLPSDLCKTGCAPLRIANCKLFRLQLKQGLFQIRVPST